jgi:hypothetical protein
VATDGGKSRGYAALFGAGSAAGVLLVFGALLAYGLGAGYFASIPTPFNVLVALAVFTFGCAMAAVSIRTGWRSAATAERHGATR